MAMKSGCSSNTLPVRRRLPHEIPGWVQQGARHFITINAADRAACPFSAPDVAHALLDSLVFYDASRRWFLWAATIMPDHLHFIAMFDLSVGIQKTVGHWKQFNSRKKGVSFQPDFFEHRIRDEKEFAETIAYIRENPVKRRLVERSEDWAFFWIRNRVTS
jgi:putative transposase